MIAGQTDDSATELSQGYSRTTTSTTNNIWGLEILESGLEIRKINKIAIKNFQNDLSFISQQAKPEPEQEQEQASIAR